MQSLWTIGHSNREWGDFLALLEAETIQTLVDVRRFPGSRRHPQFNTDALAAALENAGLTYIHLPDLGGRRNKSTATTQNAGWRIAAFAAYADYMSTDAFNRAFEQLADIAAKSRTAIMCAEALPWQCHRRLIADRFVVQGWRVQDIVGHNQIREHSLPPFASVTNGQLTYPGEH